MLIVIPRLLNDSALARAQAILDSALFGDGRVTAGTLAASAKQNLQLPSDSPQTRALQALIGAALEASVDFVSAALPRRVHPALINRYLPGMAFGAHVDNAIRFDDMPLRADLAATLFLNAPEHYDGGALAIDDSYGARAVKGNAGDLVLYPASSIHAVQPITRGRRDVAVLWVQSLVREAGQRRALYELDCAIRSLRERAPESPEILSLTGVYHNLLRAAAEL